MVRSMADIADVTALTVATLLPFVAFLLILIFTRKKPRLSAALAIGAVSVSLACSLALMGLNLNMTGPFEYSVRLLASSGLAIR